MFQQLLSIQLFLLEIIQSQEEAAREDVDPFLIRFRFEMNRNGAGGERWCAIIVNRGQIRANAGAYSALLLWTPGRRKGKRPS